MEKIVDVFWTNAFFNEACVQNIVWWYLQSQMFFVSSSWTVSSWKTLRFLVFSTSFGNLTPALGWKQFCFMFLGILKVWDRLLKRDFSTFRKVLMEVEAECKFKVYEFIRGKIGDEKQVFVYDLLKYLFFWKWISCKALETKKNVLTVFL